jgi:hypothetical protein
VNPALVHVLGKLKNRVIFFHSFLAITSCNPPVKISYNVISATEETKNQMNNEKECLDVVL